MCDCKHFYCLDILELVTVSFILTVPHFYCLDMGVLVTISEIMSVLVPDLVPVTIPVPLSKEVGIICDHILLPYIMTMPYKHD